MSSTTAFQPPLGERADPYKLGRRTGGPGHGHGGGPGGDATGHGAGGPASKRIITGYGFWIF
ncbi:MAG: hypothetical protein JOZ05_07935, partial [Acetobacteraceae bacterium]|nr:hypothetical protein [Acetobacteraceae bacterium]